MVCGCVHAVSLAFQSNDIVADSYISVWSQRYIYVMNNGSGVWDMASSWMFSRGCFTATVIDRSMYTLCGSSRPLHYGLSWLFRRNFHGFSDSHWQSACTAPGNIKLMPAVSDVQGDCEDVYGHRMLDIQAWALTSKVSVHSKHCSNWVW